jgi:hypothetical protein
MGSEIFEELCRLAQDDFCIAADRGAKNPEGISLITRDGIILTGYGDVDYQTNPATRALRPLTENISPEITRDDLPKAFEIAAIVIATKLDAETRDPQAPSQETLDALGHYIGTADGQEITLISAHDTCERRSLKL